MVIYKDNIREYSEMRDILGGVHDGYLFEARPDGRIVHQVWIRLSFSDKGHIAKLMRNWIGV